MLEGADGTVTTDASRCQQIFGNLVANALKYTPEGGNVRVAGRNEGDQWLVIVSDSGPGIPPEALTKVFKPFYRLAHDEHSGVEGNGLGLAICREMVDQMGGQIAISSAVGQGTRVTVQLPVEAPGPSPPGASRSAGTFSRFRSCLSGDARLELSVAAPLDPEPLSFGAQAHQVGGEITRSSRTGSARGMGDGPRGSARAGARRSPRISSARASSKRRVGGRSD